MIHITTLMDNTNGQLDTVCEHGLSFLVERQGRAILFDTGKTGLFLKNASVSGLDIHKAEALVVSHGHYDHAGGVRSLYEKAGFTGDLWIGSGFFDKKWSMDPAGPRYTGLDFDESFLSEKNVITHTLSAGQNKTVAREISPGIFAVNGFSALNAYEKQNTRFVVDRDGQRILDDFRDEVCIALPLDQGVAVLLGCAHPGMMNMLEAVKTFFKKPVQAVFGGSHLVEADQSRLDASIQYLRDSGCSLTALGHCTGPKAIEKLSKELSSYQALYVGSTYSIQE